MRASNKARQNVSLSSILIAILVCGVIGIGVFNYLKPSYHGFFKATAINCVTLLVAIVVSYFLAQRENDKRKKKDIFSNFVMKFRSEISAPAMYNLGETKSCEITMMLRDMNNYIDVMEKVMNEFGIAEEVEFIKAKFNEYEETVSDHISNTGEFGSLQNELKRPLRLIDTELLEIALKIYT